jgi:hypothetical protein
MTIAIGTFVKLATGENQPTGYAFQNFYAGETRSFDGTSYMYGAFGFSGGTLDLEAGNVSASLVFAVNELDLVVFKEAADSRWLAKVDTVWLDPETLNETGTYSREIYAITGFEHDTNRLSVRLGNPLDAVSQNAPRRVLTQRLVGNLPSTGNINLS